MLFKAIYFLLKIIIIPIPNLSGSLIDTFPINISLDFIIKFARKYAYMRKAKETYFNNVKMATSTPAVEAIMEESAINLDASLGLSS